MTHGSELSRAGGGRGVAGSLDSQVTSPMRLGGLPLQLSAFVAMHIACSLICVLKQQQQWYNLGRLRFHRRQASHPTLGSCIVPSPNQAAQPNPSYPALCRQDNHISMEHRLRRKQFFSVTLASNKTYLKETQEKKKRRNFVLEKNETEKRKRIKKGENFFIQKNRQEKKRKDGGRGAKRYLPRTVQKKMIFLKRNDTRNF